MPRLPAHGRLACTARIAFGATVDGDPKTVYWSGRGDSALVREAAAVVPDSFVYRARRHDLLDRHPRGFGCAIIAIDDEDKGKDTSKVAG